MNNRILRAVLMLFMVLLLTGCAQRTVDQMYSLPKRSEEYGQLQSAVDAVMGDREYSAPRSGDNQQTVQMADLDGDGKEEILVFAKGGTEKPMHILVFCQDINNNFTLMEVLENSGSAFEQVEYVQIDGKPGVELVVGRVLSDQVPRSVSVYTFHEGFAEQLISTGYSRLLTCDLDSNGLRDLLVIQPGESDTGRGVATLFSYTGGIMNRSPEVALFNQAENVRRVMTSPLQSGEPSIFVAGTSDENTVITDILTVKDGTLVNLAASLDAHTGVQTLRNYYVYADDVDADGVLELPSLIPMRNLTTTWETEPHYLVRWYSLDSQGKEQDKLFSFHNFAEGWYLQLDSSWAERIALDQQENDYTFYIWSEDFQEALPVFSVYVLTGAERDVQAVEQNRFVLYQGEDVVYAGKLRMASGIYGITEEQLINSFRLIHQNWKTGET